MALVTLTTDFGLEDFYAAAVVGELKSRVPGVDVVNISHNIPKFNIPAGALILKNCWRSFPEGTIHIVGVNTDAMADQAYIVLEKEGHFFIGADNGFFNLLLDEELPDQIYSIDFQITSDIFTFPVKEVFVPAAAHLAKGGTIAMLGRKLEALRPVTAFEPVIDAYTIRGSVLYVDSYGNSITNIKKEVFSSLCRNRNFEITFRDPEISVSVISQRYTDVEEGEVVAFFGSTGLLEIAINQGRAAQLLRLETNSIVMIQFYD